MPPTDEHEVLPGLTAPYVNRCLMRLPRFDNRLVRLPCILKSHDLATAVVQAADGLDVNVVLTTAFTRRKDGSFRPVQFAGTYFVLEGIVKNKGWALMLMKEPEPIGKSDMGLIDSIISYASDPDWLACGGHTPRDARLEAGHGGEGRPAILDSSRQNAKRVKRIKADSCSGVDDVSSFSTEV